MAADRIRMRRVSCYFTNGTAQAFTNREDQSFDKNPGSLVLVLDDGAITIEREHLCYFRVTYYWQEAKAEPQQLPAAEAPVANNDLL